MKSKDELKETDIKSRMYYYFDDLLRDREIDLSDVLLDENSHENILIYDIWYKAFMGAKKNRCVFGPRNRWIY